MNIQTKATMSKKITAAYYNIDASNTRHLKRKRTKTKHFEGISSVVDSRRWNKINKEIKITEVPHKPMDEPESIINWILTAKVNDKVYYKGRNVQVIEVTEDYIKIKYIQDKKIRIIRPKHEITEPGKGVTWNNWVFNANLNETYGHRSLGQIKVLEQNENCIVCKRLYQKSEETCIKKPKSPSLQDAKEGSVFWVFHRSRWHRGRVKKIVDKNTIDFNLEYVHKEIKICKHEGNFADELIRPLSYFTGKEKKCQRPTCDFLGLKPVGNKLEIYWKKDDTWYTCNVLSYDRTTKLHSVLYGFDGDTLDEDFVDLAATGYIRFDNNVDSHSNNNIGNPGSSSSTSSSNNNNSTSRSLDMLRMAVEETPTTTTTTSTRKTSTAPSLSETGSSSTIMPGGNSSNSGSSNGSSHHIVHNCLGDGHDWQELPSKIIICRYCALKV